ncbi:FAD-dependent oxidoreductase [Streptomyces sp. NPDC093252]|uniref:FAD-dependent oxidoreductase n=1 Tax=Streptomyces sp. NPDC093252 TaxID=3154980 RepID=UPI0034190A39
MSEQISRRPDVIVVGAGPVGLATALQLARSGAAVRILERQPGPVYQPRAHVVNGRTMELFRSWGIADAVRRAGLPLDLARSFAWVTEARAEEFAQIDYIDRDTAERYSPETLCSCPQDHVEQALRDALEATGTTVEYGHEVVGYRAVEKNGRTLAEVAVRGPDGTVSPLRARYAVAADGASSPLRRLAGVAMERSVPLGRRINVYFHADLTPYTRDRPHILWFVHNPATQGVLIPLDPRARWVYSTDLDPGETLDDYDEERCLALIRAAVGDPGLDVDQRTRMTWKMDMGVAERFRSGPLFLVGDAAHRFPPTGGFGMNSGIQDSHNLAWKLDLVLRGLAGDALLDSYEAERRPVAEFNAIQCTANAEEQIKADAFLNSPQTLALLGAPEGTALRDEIARNVAGLREQFHSLGQQFGHIYRDGAVHDDGSPVPVSTITEYRPSARPGARAPHARLRSGGETDRAATSTVELVTGCWSLLVAGDPGGWERAAADAVSALDVRVHGIGGAEGLPGGFTDAVEPGHWQSLYELSPGGAVLIRPDGHVLARWALLPADPAAELARALSHVLESVQGGGGGGAAEQSSSR